MKKMVILFIIVYQRTLSYLLADRCRFFPSCSTYMKEAIEKQGLIRGTWKGLMRLGRCHPWSSGGLDPLS